MTRRTSGLRRPAAGKIAWSGTLTSVQPRIRLMRSFDQRSHTYQRREAFPKREEIAGGQRRR